MAVIQVQDVAKSYRNNPVLSGVTMTLQEGLVYGLLGRNGAGKSTLLNIISNRTLPTSGTVLVDGVPALENDQALQKIYCVSETHLYPGSSKVRQMFWTVSQFYPGFQMEYAMDLCKRFKLNPEGKLAKLSTGYITIAKNIAALASGAEIVFFDEPVLGLDANHRFLFYQALQERKQDFLATYVISTHLIDEAANLMDRVLILKYGRIMTDEDTGSLLNRGFTVTGPAALVDQFTAGRQLLGADLLGGIKSAYVMGSCDDLPEGLERSPMNLQRLFILLTEEDQFV